MCNLSSHVGERLKVFSNKIVPGVKYKRNIRLELGYKTNLAYLLND